MKTTYALAAVPSILVLITLGAAPLLRTRWGRAGVHAWLAAWIFLVGVAYWAQPRPGSAPREPTQPAHSRVLSRPAFSSMKRRISSAIASSFSHCSL